MITSASSDTRQPSTLGALPHFLGISMAIALVTGTSSGIGLATAVTLARGGHTVVATMRNPDSADELRSIIAAENLPIIMETLNVDDDASVAKSIGNIVAEYGHLDILVNNAGLAGDGLSVEETSTARFREGMETNFFGTLRCIKAVVPGMRERRHGCIVNVSSIYGRLAMAPAAAYCASKFALEALSECLAQEMKAFKVRVAIIEPGVIATRMPSNKMPIPAGSPYPHARRERAIIAKSLTNPISPYVVAEKIREIVDGNSWQLRYPVGPDVEPFFRWRASKTDEEMISLAAASDAQFVRMVKQELGLDISL
jgi:NAD(P)-dependent dehydrogenase (short-subunit alcohol dehydrogenase family)